VVAVAVDPATEGGLGADLLAAQLAARMSSQHSNSLDVDPVVDSR
jgi:hypothetical protein